MSENQNADFKKILSIFFSSLSTRKIFQASILNVSGGLKEEMVNLNVLMRINE